MNKKQLIVERGDYDAEREIKGIVNGWLGLV
jgi:hypothetical protein